MDVAECQIRAHWHLSYAPLAQLVEQLTLNQWVPGSNPWRCTKKFVLLLQRVHLFPFRTQKLSSVMPTILGWRRPGKIGQRKHSSLAQSVEHLTVNQVVAGSSPAGGANKKTSFVYWTKEVFFNDVCLRQMMLATPMMTATPNDVWLRHILGQISHHCDPREQHHICVANTSRERSECFIFHTHPSVFFFLLLCSHSQPAAALLRQVGVGRTKERSQCEMKRLSEGAAVEGFKTA